MKFPFNYKGSVLGLLLTSFAFTVNAQKIDEQELKTNVSKITNSSLQLKKLEPVTFNYDQKFKHLNLPSGSQYGFLSDNLKKEFPEMVYEASKFYNSGKNNSRIARYNQVDMEKLIPVMVAAIKEQQEEIELLKAALSQLKLNSR